MSLLISNWTDISSVSNLFKRNSIECQVNLNFILLSVPFSRIPLISQYLTVWVLLSKIHSHLMIKNKYRLTTETIRYFPDCSLKPALVHLTLNDWNFFILTQQIEPFHFIGNFKFVIFSSFPTKHYLLLRTVKQHP